MTNFDSDGKIRWNPIDLNVYGEVPRLLAKRKPRVSTGDAPLTGNIDFFLEYHSELSKKSKSGKPLWERKEKIFDWMGEKWHLGWATGWATSGDMLNDNGYRGHTIRQENRIRNDDYDIPFFRDSQVNLDDPRYVRLVLADEEGFVRLIRGDWMEYDPYEEGERLEEEQEATEGCILEDVRWIQVPFDGVMVIP